jgi:hypothetical protein
MEEEKAGARRINFMQVGTVIPLVPRSFSHWLKLMLIPSKGDFLILQNEDQLEPIPPPLDKGGTISISHNQKKSGARSEDPAPDGWNLSARMDT